jgi:hypothetical protein
MKGGREVFIFNMKIEDAGTDTLYVIMSLDKQARLENLIQAYNTSPNPQSANTLYREVVSLQNAASGLGEPASSFIASAGTPRGNSEKEEFATRLSSKNMYVRPITFRH